MRRRRRECRCWDAVSWATSGWGPVGTAHRRTVAGAGGVCKSFDCGDYIESRGQTGRLEACRETARLIREAGGIADVLSLPDEGVRANTHLSCRTTTVWRSQTG